MESEDAAARNAEWTCALSDWEEAVAEVDRQGQKLQKEASTRGRDGGLENAATPTKVI